MNDNSTSSVNMIFGYIIIFINNGMEMKWADAMATVVKNEWKWMITCPFEAYI